MKNWVIIICTVVILFIIASVYTAYYYSHPTYQMTTVTMGGRSFKTEIADTAYLQEKGLSSRVSIAKDYAMMFVFSSPGNNKFWMKDMNFPIDIIWLDADKKIIFIEKNLQPTSYPHTFGPDNNSLYVIEVASGTADMLGLTVNQSVTFSL